MSLIKFQSPTQGSVIMFAGNAQHLLDTLGLPERGEITAEQLPRLISLLQEAIHNDQSQNPIIWPDKSDQDIDTEAPALIHFSQRASPMLHLMERCLASSETIQW